MDEFIRAIIDSGLKPPSDIFIDGKIHRFASNNKIRNKDGYYALFDNGDGLIGGFFGCWRMGIKQNWFNNKSKETLKEEERKYLQKKSLKKGYSVKKKDKNKTIRLQKKHLQSGKKPFLHPTTIHT